jgi:hypothetical protein
LTLQQVFNRGRSQRQSKEGLKISREGKLSPQESRNPFEIERRALVLRLRAGLIATNFPTSKTGGLPLLGTPYSTKNYIRVGHESRS